MITEDEPLRGRIEVGVDHIAVTFQRLDIEEVGGWLETLLGGEFVRAEKAMLGYASMFVGPGGVKVLFDNSTDRYAGDVHAILPGKACRSLSESAVRGAFGFIDATGGRCSRVDLAADDFAKRVTPTEFREHRNSSTVVTKTRPGRLYSDDCTGGSTFYVGARTSRVMARVYDKAAESRGNINAIRYELEFKVEAAEQMQHELIDGHWGDVWASHMVKLIDFRERWVDSNVTRCPRVTWWEELVGDARRAAPYLAVKPKTVEESMKWLKRQCGPMLAAVAEVYGGQVVHHILADGRRRWRLKHEQLIARGREERAA